MQNPEQENTPGSAAWVEGMVRDLWASGEGNSLHNGSGATPCGLCQVKIPCEERSPL